MGTQSTQLGDRHLEVRQHLQQERLGLDLDPIDLVDQQHHRRVGTDRLEERTSQQEVLCEDVRLELIPFSRLLGLDPKQLLLVVPLVERLGLVEPLVALQPNQSPPVDLGERLGQLGLADAGGPFHEHRLVEPLGQKHDLGDLVGREIPHGLQGVGDLCGRCEGHGRTS